MNINIVECKNLERWDNLVSISQHGCVFCKSWFLKAQGEPFLLYIAVVEGEDVAGVIVFPDKLGFMKKASRPYAMYQGVIIKDRTSETISKTTKFNLALAEFIVDFFTKKYKSISWCMHYAFNDLRPFLWFNYGVPESKFNIDVRYSALIDIGKYSCFDVFVDGLDVKRKREYRNCLKTKITTCRNGNLDEFLALYEMTFARQSIKLSEGAIAVVRSIIEISLQRKSGEFITVRNDEGLAVAMNFILHDERSSYYMFSAGHDDFRDQRNGLYCMLASIQSAFKRGSAYFDMVGVNSPGRGFFKTSFNARPVPYYVLDWSIKNCKFINEPK